MKSVLNTILASDSFMYKKQGYYNNYALAAPIANKDDLLPFITKSFSNVLGATVTGYLYTICGNLVTNLGELDLVEHGDRVTVVFDKPKTALNLPLGYYYVLGVGTVYAGNPQAIYDQHAERVLRAGGKSYAETCVVNSLNNLLGGDEYIDLFKTEVFYVNTHTSSAAGKPSFNSSFNESFKN